ncbi:MAG: hypothetical protein ACIAS6_04980 [Phycisphaerales bacterium JB060]
MKIMGSRSIILWGLAGVGCGLLVFGGRNLATAGVVPGEPNNPDGMVIGEPGMWVIPIQNQSWFNDAAITRVETSCGCLIVDLWPSQLGPREHSEILLSGSPDARYASLVQRVTIHVENRQPITVDVTLTPDVPFEGWPKSVCLEPTEPSRWGFTLGPFYKNHVQSIVGWTSTSVPIVGSIDSATGRVTFGAASDPGLVPDEVVIVFGNGPSDVWSGPAELVHVSEGAERAKGGSLEDG